MRNLKERATTNAKNYECVIKMFGRHDRKFERERTRERARERKSERKRERYTQRYRRHCVLNG